GPHAPKKPGRGCDGCYVKKENACGGDEKVREKYEVVKEKINACKRKIVHDETHHERSSRNVAFILKIKLLQFLKNGSHVSLRYQNDSSYGRAAGMR
ncbi:MAG: hypothetical protein NUV80_01170, partial [Candidatus Berkelbacteria bacterium]|nr:hypothetical protein [Candidatus Berkelbacteria bacterium]